MTNILAHNSRGDAVVFTVDGRLIGPHQTRPGDPTDPLTSRLLACGRLVEVGETEEPAPGMEPPSGNAPRAEWVEYAVFLGYDRQDVEGMKRNELRDLLTGTGGMEPEPVEPGGGEPEQADPGDDAGDPDETTGPDEPENEGTEPTGGADSDSEKETQ